MTRLIFFTLFVFLFAKMFKSKKYLVSQLASLILISTLVLHFSSCTSKYEEEISRTKDLQQTLIDNNENLKLDAPMFRSRTEYIQETLMSFNNDYPETMDLELGNTLSRLKSIKKIYIKSTQKYDKCSKEQAELESQITNLIQDLENNAISKEAFLSYYKTEKMDIDLLIVESKQTNQLLYSLEPEYTRLIKTLEPYLKKLK